MKEPFPFSRRHFLRTTAAAGLLTGIESILPAYARAGRRLPRTGGPYDLTIARKTLEIGGRRTNGLSINGTMPGPLVRLREGEDALIRVTNQLEETASIHWHGFLLPFRMDGVPGISYPGIRPGETFTYRFPVRQSGTYWYHSHSALQEQLGVVGPAILDPAGADPVEYDREYVVMLGDWLYMEPATMEAKLKKDSDYSNYQARTMGDFLRDASKQGLAAALQNRAMWGKMRMNPTDLADITGHYMTYLINGQAPESNWTALFEPGERVRLRFINSASITFFDVRIPGLPLRVVQADGQNVKPVTVHEFRIGVAETYDVIVEPRADRAYTIFAEALDRSGYARGTLAPHAGMSADIPPLRVRPVRTMADMGMAMGAMGGMGGGQGEKMGHAAGSSMAGMDMDAQEQSGGMAGMEPKTKDSSMAGMSGMSHPSEKQGAIPIVPAPGGTRAGLIQPNGKHGPDEHGPGNQAVAEMPQNRLHEPGLGLENTPWRVLVYTDLQSLEAGPDRRPPEREIELHATGNMDRYMWSFDGKKSSEVAPIPFYYGERLRFTWVNDTMMEHPLHLHGMFMELDNGHGPHKPRKHTIILKPGEKLSTEITADAPGVWAFHCHILYHMERGMFRVVMVAPKVTPG